MQFVLTFVIAYISGIVVSLFFIDNYREYRLIKASKLITRVASYDNLQTCLANIASGKSNSFDIHPTNGTPDITVRVVVTGIPPLKTYDSTKDAAPAA